MKQSGSNQSLPRSTPEQEGISSEAILAFLDSIEGNNFQLHSFMLLRHGRVVAEAWWRPYEPACRRYLYSLSKSFTSTAVGFAVQEGLLKVEDRVTSFFPEDLPTRIDDNLAAMQVKHLLTMSTGHDVDSTIMMLPEGLINWAQSILSISVAFPPGTHFLYNTGATYLLSCIVQRVTGMTLLDFLSPRLFEPLGISGMTWESCPRGINVGGWGLSLATEDLAKFGQFYLQKGFWNGRQLLDSAWVDAATCAQVDNKPVEQVDENYDWQQGYGYQFWRCQHNAYRGDGAFGQYCIVMPAQEAVLVMTSETPNMQDPLNLVWKHLLPKMRSGSLPPQPEALGRLETQLAALQVPLPPNGQPPAQVERVSGKRYGMQENSSGIQAACLSFEQDSCRFHLWDAEGEYQIVGGNHSWKESQAWLPLMQPVMTTLTGKRAKRDLLKVAAAGQWIDPQTFGLTVQFLETPHSNTFILRFHEDTLELEVSSPFEDPHHPGAAGTKKLFHGSLQAPEAAPAFK